MRKSFISQTLLIALSVFSFNAIAQQQLGCGNPSVDMSQNEDHQEFLRAWNNGTLNDSRATIYVPIVLHLVGDNDGSNRISVADALDRLCKVNADFAPSEIFFFLKDINFISNTVANRGTDGNQSDNLGDYRRANSVNVFFATAAMSGTTVVCGYYCCGATQGSPNMPDIVVVGNGCMASGSTTLSHELGHYMSLPHTFNGWEFLGQNGNIGAAPNFAERVDGQNCSNAGDDICDTKPDYLPSRWNCDQNGESPWRVIFSDGRTFELIDPTNDTFQVDGTNYMSYSDDACMTQFSPMQRSKMRNYINNRRSNLLNQAPTIMDTITAQVSAIYPVLGDTIQNVSNAVFSWHPVANASRYSVEIWRSTVGGNPLQFISAYQTADTTLNVSGLPTNQFMIWRVKPYNPYYTCAANSPWKRFRTGSTGVGVQSVNIPTELLNIAPNPVTVGELVRASFNIDQAAGDATISVCNLSGQIQTTWQQPLVLGENNLLFDTNNLPVGMYILRVETPEKQAFGKFIIFK